MSVLDMLRGAIVRQVLAFEDFNIKVTLFAAAIGQQIRTATKMVAEDIEGLVLNATTPATVTVKVILPLLINYCKVVKIDNVVGFINKNFDVKVVNVEDAIRDFIVVAGSVKGNKLALVLTPKSKFATRLMGMSKESAAKFCYSTFRANGYNANVVADADTTMVLHSLVEQCFKDILAVVGEDHWAGGVKALAQTGREVSPTKSMRSVKYILIRNTKIDGATFMVLNGPIDGLDKNELVNKPLKMSGLALVGKGRIGTITKNVAANVLVDSDFNIIDKYNLAVVLPKLETFLGRELTEVELLEYKSGIDAGYDVCFSNHNIFKDVNTKNAVTSRQISEAIASGILYGEHAKVNVSSDIRPIRGFTKGSANNYLPWMLSMLGYRNATQLKGLYVSNIIATSGYGEAENDYVVYVSASTYKKFKKYLSLSMSIGRSPSTGDIVMARVVVVEDSKAIAPIYFSENVMPVLNGDYDGDGIAILSVTVGMPKELVEKELSMVSIDSKSIITEGARFRLPISVGTLYNHIVDNGLTRNYFNGLLPMYSKNDKGIYVRANGDVDSIKSKVDDITDKIKTISAIIKATNDDIEIEALDAKRENMSLLKEHYKSLNINPKVRTMDFHQWVCIMNIIVDDNGLPYNGVISPVAQLGEIDNFKEYVDTIQDGRDLAEEINEIVELLTELFTSTFNNPDTGEREEYLREEMVEFINTINSVDNVYEKNVILHKFAGTYMVGIFANCDFHFGQLVALNQGVSGCVLLSEYLIQEVVIQMQKKIQPLGKFTAALKYALNLNKSVDVLTKSLGIVKWAKLDEVPEIALEIEQANMAVAYLADHHINIVDQMNKMYETSRFYATGKDGMFDASEHSLNEVTPKVKSVFERVLLITKGLFLYEAPVEDEYGNIIGGGVAPGYHGNMIKFINELYRVETIDQLDSLIINHHEPQFASDTVTRLTWNYLQNGTIAKSCDESLVDMHSVIEFVCWMLSSRDRIATMAFVLNRTDILGEINIDDSIWAYSYFKVPFIQTIGDLHQLKMDANYGVSYAAIRDSIVADENGMITYHPLVKTTTKAVADRQFKMINTKGNLVGVLDDHYGNVQLKFNNPKDIKINLGIGEYSFNNGVTTEEDYLKIITIIDNTIYNLNAHMSNRLLDGIDSDYIDNQVILECILGIGQSNMIDGYDEYVWSKMLDY